MFSEPFDQQEDDVFFWSMMFLMIAVISGLALSFQAFCFGTSGERLTLRLRDIVFRTYLRQEIAYFDDHRNSTGALCARLSTDAAMVHGATGAHLGGILLNFSALVTSVMIGLVYSGKLTLLMLGFGPAIGLASAMKLHLLRCSTTTCKKSLEEAGKVR